MKAIIILLSVAALIAAAPKAPKLNYRNLFRDPVKQVKVAPKPHIIGGQEAEPHSIPYQAFLEVSSNFEAWYCGGSLISTISVLTAGHCINEGIEARVTLGAHRILQNEDTQVTVITSDLIVHEEYNEDLIINDIGIIRLPAAVNLTNAIQVVAIPLNNQTNYTGNPAIMSGWGLTDGSGNQLSDVLNYVNVTVIGNDECGTYFSDLDDTIICTSGDAGTGACDGDSGGPLIANNIQIGIVSFGVRYCLAGYPSGFTRIDRFLAWIGSKK